MSRFVIAVGRIGLVIGGVLVATLIAEGAARLRDGQPLFSRYLNPVWVPPGTLALDAESGGGPLAADVQAAWLTNPPPATPPERPAPALFARAVQTARNGVPRFEAFRVWNAELVRRHGCDIDSTLRRQPQPITVFDPVEPGVEDPPFRYLAGRSLPGGLVTNRFGFRGPDVPIDKPPDTIRLAFVGASTTVGLWNLPWAYPELVVYWLNTWAAANHLSVRFDGVNAGREGIGSNSIVAITAQEVIPLEPDLVVYYEGANQSLCTVPALDAPRPQLVGSSLAGLDAWAAQWQDVSELARRLRGVLVRARMQGGGEPPKPVLPPNADRDAYGGPPQLERTDLPSRERLILTDLDTLRRTVENSGAELVLTSFKWLVADGLQLDPLRDTSIFRQLNEQCWPYRYADIRRAADLHNGLVAAFAARYSLPFIDVAGFLPDDPRLFYDAVHVTADGTRLQAWITFRGLLPLIRAKLASGEWPRPDRIPQTTHPALAPTREVTLHCP